jgi:hypothetical protein
VKKVEVYVQYQNLIDDPPVATGALYQQSCSNDTVTVSSWRDTWINQTKANKERFSSFAAHGIGEIWGKHQNKPVIIAGSGPSLKENAHHLKDRGEIPLVSCLHNFHYFEDLGVAPEYYVSLDAGPVTIEEVSEGGSKTAEEYWEITKDRTLLCYIGTHPELLAKWKGKVLFFNCPIPDPAVEKELDNIESFNQYVSTGGNVLGACLYIAKGYLGASTVIFVGADFCFSYDHKFHAWNSKYDKNLGQCVTLTDVYGIKRLTWQSYANFKGWFDYVALSVPGFYINACEGGCLGSYPTGNLKAFRYMDLVDVFKMFHMNSHTKSQALNPEIDKKIILF